MSRSDERRVSFRMPFATEVICYVDELDKKYSGTLRDLSITSLFMEADDCPHIGCKCDIGIILEGEHSRLEIKNVSGSIVRSDDNGVAICFDERLEWFALVPLYFHKLRD
ncbi:MAG: hypothetical protein DRI24_24090 [Deltaproteobacteria bacterium]|nr:MAG: hypothetical protein DRI24_24090 [Deltaproteobacteria bacterium]